MPNHYGLRGRLLLGLWVLSGFFLTVHATHIVGGELSLQYLGGNRVNTHRLSLNLYFDLVYGNAGARDASVIVGVFSKRTNELVSYHTLPLSNTALVAYTNPSCTAQNLQTQLLTYATDLTLAPANYNDPGGYYITWERCCRNSVITNISNPGSAGSTFYMEFPALASGGQTVLNSSPAFRPIAGDYACLNTPFSFNFGATDADGDSLSYQLVTPYNGYSSTGNPNPSVPTGALGQSTFYNGPYPEVRWITGLGVDNQIPGSVPLRVNARTGLLTLTANRLGLFVFSVQVTEFRRGLRLGCVRRDFQLLVIDCPKDIPPTLLMRLEGRRGFYREGDVLTIAEADTNCLTLLTTDPDPGQRITVSNLSGSLPGLSVGPASLLIQTKSDTLTTKFCFGRCLARADGKPITLAILATDDACPQGRSDTLYVTLNIVPSRNDKPVASTNLPGNAAKVSVGKSLTFSAFGTDVNNDDLTLTATGRGFALTSANMSFAPVNGKGRVSGPFSWQPQCAQGQRDYVVDFVVTDNRCSNPRRDTVTVRLTAEALPSRPPTVTTTLSPTAVTISLPLPPGTDGTLRFDVLGDDIDSDPVRLAGQGRGFDMRAAGVSFADRTGKPLLRSALTWTPGCALLRGRDSTAYVLEFSADDGSCDPNHLVTTTVLVNLISPPVDKTLRMPNVFTPNNDGKNDAFSAMNLPGANCAERFEYVEVFNRWGQSVFRSPDPKFAWLAEGFPVGEYFYHLQYSVSSYKGSITLLR
jgi:gliding motility-associated-like protein